MCYMLYIASKNNLPLIPSEDWNGIDTANDSWITKVKPLSIKELSQRESGVLKKFSECNVVYAGSYEGCGCGYSHCTIDPDIENDPEETRASLNSRQALFDYVSKYDVSSIYGCWDGDQTDDCEGVREIKPDKLVDINYVYPEKVLLTIKKL